MTILYQTLDGVQALPASSGGSAPVELPGDSGGYQAAYNRSTRHWETWRGDYDEALIVGGVTAYPAGKLGKRAAMLAAIRGDDPRVADEVEAIIKNRPDNEAIINRAIRAGQLVVGGHVRQGLPITSPYSYNGEVARVVSQQYPSQNYAVCEHPGSMYCTCKDYENGWKQEILNQDHPERPRYGAPLLPGIGYFCKHIAAWLICCSLADGYEPELDELEIPFE